MKYSLITFFLVYMTTIPGIAQTPADKAQADSLYKNYQNKKALKIYNKILADNSTNLDALWHSSLLYSRIGDKLKKKARKKKYYKRAMETSKKALSIDKMNSNANFAMAVAVGEMARIGSIEQKLDAASEIKKYATNAVKADSTNAGAWFVLGGWNYKISTMNSVKETAANILGGVPNGASLEKAQQYMQKAIKLHPSYILYYLWLARTYKARGKNNLAVKTCQTAIKKSKATPSDSDYKKECQKLINGLQ